MSERFRQSVTDCFSSCTASLGVFLQVERGFFGLCTALQKSIHPSLTGKAELRREESSLVQGCWLRRRIIPMVMSGPPCSHWESPLLPPFPKYSVSKPKTTGFQTKLLSRNIFGSQPNSAILHGKRWLKYQGTQHGAAEVAGDCQNAIRQDGKTKNASGDHGCWAIQAGSGLQVGAVAVVIFSLHLVVCLSATPTCPAHWWEQLGFSSVATDDSETTQITDLAVMQGPSNALVASWHLAAPIHSPPRASRRLHCSQPRSLWTCNALV